MSLFGAFSSLIAADTVVSKSESGLPVELRLGGLPDAIQLSKVSGIMAWRKRLFLVALHAPAVVCIATYLLLLWSEGEARAQKWFVPVFLVVVITVAIQWARFFAPEIGPGRSAWKLVETHGWQVFASGVPVFTKQYVVMTDNYFAIYGSTGRCIRLEPWTSVDYALVESRGGLLFVELTDHGGANSIVRFGPQVTVSTNNFGFRSRNEPTASTMIATGRFVAVSPH